MDPHITTVTPNCFVQHVSALCNTFLSSPHLCFIIVFICDLFVSRDDPLMS